MDLNEPVPLGGWSSRGRDRWRLDRLADVAEDFANGACPKRVHAPEEATRWFSQWHVYRAIVDANWMADFRQRQGENRYVAGALPELPFEDGAFDLVLSANFLMVYAPLADGGMHDGNEFGLEFHRRAFRELATVC